MILSLLLCSVSAYIEEQPIKNYFNECLESQLEACYEPKTYECEMTVSLEDISDTRQKVWQLWADANSQFTYTEKREEAPRTKMIPFGGWLEYTIPQSLEPYVAEPGEPDKYSGPNAKMLYRFGRKGSASSDPLPFIILTHGSGTVSEEIDAVYKVALNNNDAPCVYFVPRIPNGVYGYYRWYQKPKQWVWEKVLRQMMLRSDIDHDRMYFTGISEGAYGSQLLASYYADYFAGFGPMAGGGPLVDSPCENLRNTYFNLTTGSFDTNYNRNGLTALAGEYLDSLQAQDPEGYHHKATIVPGVTHSSTPYHLTTPDLLQHSRPSNPRIVRWENFKLDGRYRYGFHNLRVYERSEPETGNDYSRTYYEMNINGNHIDMVVSVTDYEITRTYTDYGTTIPVSFIRTLTPATSGRFKIYLNEELVDLTKEVELSVNGKLIFTGQLQPNIADMVTSSAEFYDPERVFPTSIEVDITTMEAKALTTDVKEIFSEEKMHFYTLQGVEVATPTEPGIYIRRHGTNTSKIIIR